MRDIPVGRDRKDMVKNMSYKVWSGSLLLAFCLCTFAADAVVKDPVKKVLPRESIGPDFLIGSGDPSLALKVVVVDGVVASVAAAEVEEANVFATRSGNDEQTSLSVRTTLDVTIKLDLYVSRDGKAFEYASSCAVTPGISSSEIWQYPVREFALGNPRVLPAGKMDCD